MDRKTVLTLVAAFGLFYVWMWGVGKMFPPTKLPPSTNIVATATNAAAVGTNVSVTNAVTANVPAGTNAITSLPSAPEETVTLETADSIYTFTSHGGGIKTVKLKQFPENVKRRGTAPSTNVVTLNAEAKQPMLAIQPAGDNVFTLTKTPTNTVIAEKLLPDGVRVVKQFEPRSNYLVRATVWFQNTTAQPVQLPSYTVEAGTMVPTEPDEQPTTAGIFWHNGSKAEQVQDGWFDNHAFGCFFKRPRAEYDSGTNRVLWSALNNQFFTLTLLPATNSVGSRFIAHRSELPARAGEKTKLRAFQGAIGYSATTIAPQQFVQQQFTIYAGPKQEKLLSSLGRGTDAICDFGFFSPISKLFLRSMNFFHRFMPYGVAIIVLTIIIKLLFWPLTAASTRSMKRMQTLSPELKKIQEKYKEDPAKMNKKVMEFWRENKVNPMSGCWPLLIQMPIFFALFRMIPNAIELRGTPFLWAHDLSRPDTVFYIPGLDFPFNPLPLLMGVTMLWQARLTPPSPGMDPAQQTMMKYMPLIFLVFLYNQPAGLTLYWTIQNLLTILQTKLTNAKKLNAAVPAPVPVKQQKKK